MKYNKKSVMLSVLATSILFTSSLISLPTYAQQVYKWVDKDGKVIYGDKVPSTVKGNVEVYSSQSLTLKRVEQRQLTDLEIAHLEEMKKKEEVNKESDKEQRRKDLALLGAYGSLADLDRIRDFELNQIDKVIKNNKDNLAALNENKVKLENDINNSKRVSPKLQDNYNNTIKEIDTNEKELVKNNDLYNKREQKFKEDKEKIGKLLDADKIKSVDPTKQ